MSFFFSNIKSQDDMAIISSLYMEHRNFMFNVANKVLNDSQASEDVVHDAFLRIMEKFHKLNFDNPNKVKSLFGITTNGLAKDEYRKRKRIDLIDEEPENDVLEAGNIEAQFVEKENYNALLSVINSLDSKYADAFLLRYEYGYSIKEISQLTGISENTVRQRLFQAKNKLKNALKEAKL